MAIFDSLAVWVAVLSVPALLAWAVSKRFDLPLETVSAWFGLVLGLAVVLGGVALIRAGARAEAYGPGTEASGQVGAAS